MRIPLVPPSRWDTIDRPFDEQSGRRGREDRVDRFLERHIERRDRDLALASDAERLAARDQDRHSRGRRQQIEDLIAEGDRVVVRWTNSGTNVGEFLGAPATNRPFTTTGIDIYRVEDGKLAEHWYAVDMYGQMVQLGRLPAPGERDGP